MKIYLAPMEGITGYRYRSVYRTFFTDADKYFTPFISYHEKLGKKEKDELSVLHNKGQVLVPQIMAGNVSEAIGLRAQINAFGYEEMNLNAGCPSGTVVHKGRGSGLLKDVDAFDKLLYELFEKWEGKLSLKTRMGFEDCEEWARIAKVIGKYPFHEVIVHGRVRSEYYKGSAHKECMLVAGEYITSPLIYNGDIFTVEDALQIQELYPDIAGIMIGRGILRSPWLITDIQNYFDGKVQADEKVRKERIYSFITTLFDSYQESFQSEQNTLFHMKELWCHLGESFPDNARELKQIKKTRKKAEYDIAISQILL